MIIKKFIGKIFNTNTYLVGSKNKKNFVCIDPSYGTQDQIIGYLKQSGGKFKYIIKSVSCTSCPSWFVKIYV